MPGGETSAHPCFGSLGTAAAGEPPLTRPRWHPPAPAGTPTLTLSSCPGSVCAACERRHSKYRRRLTHFSSWTAACRVSTHFFHLWFPGFLRKGEAVGGSDRHPRARDAASGSSHPPPPGRGSRDGGPQEPPGACCMVLGLISTSPTTVMSGVRPQPVDPCAFNPAASPQHLSGTRKAPRPGRCPGRASAWAWWGGFSTRSRCPASCSCPVPLWPPHARALFCSELTSGPPGLPSARGLERRGAGGMRGMPCCSPRSHRGV